MSGQASLIDWSYIPHSSLITRNSCMDYWRESLFYYADYVIQMKKTRYSQSVCLSVGQSQLGLVCHALRYGTLHKITVTLFQQFSFGTQQCSFPLARQCTECFNMTHLHRLLSPSHTSVFSSWESSPISCYLKLRWVIFHPQYTGDHMGIYYSEV
jgi:hypothetical protein